MNLSTSKNQQRKTATLRAIVHPKQEVCVWPHSWLILDTSVHKWAHVWACGHAHVLALSIGYI